MVESVSDAESLKRFIRDRAEETWKTRRIPYYLSLVAPELKAKGVDYRKHVGALRLSQWASMAEIPDTKFVAHPHQKAKVGFVPANVEFAFSDGEGAEKVASLPIPASKRGHALYQFVESLSKLPDDALDKFQVPAKVLITLARS